MKRIFAFLILFLAVCSMQAGVLIGSLSPVTTATTNTPTFQTNTAYITLPTVFVSNNGLAITNAYYGYFRWSFDNSTFYTNASPVFVPTTTNAGSATIAAQTVAVPIYIQMVAITNSANTSAISLGVSTP